MINKNYIYVNNNGVVNIRHHLLFKGEKMKKIICIISAAIIMLSIFAGCGNAADKAMSDVSEGASDIMSGAETVADNISGGKVTDDDGIIGNEDSKATDSTSKEDDSADSDNDNENGNNGSDASAPSDNLM